MITYKANVRLRFNDLKEGTRKYKIEIDDDNNLHGCWTNSMRVYHQDNLILDLDLKAFEISEDYEKFICDYFEGFFDGKGKPQLLSYCIERV